MENIPSNQLLLIEKDWSSPATIPFSPVTGKHLRGLSGGSVAFNRRFWKTEAPLRVSGCMGHFSNQEKIRGVYSRHPPIKPGEQQNSAIWRVRGEA